MSEDAEVIVCELAECTLWDEATLCELITRAKRYVQDTAEATARENDV